MYISVVLCAPIAKETAIPQGCLYTYKLTCNSALRFTDTIPGIDIFYDFNVALGHTIDLKEHRPNRTRPCGNSLGNSLDISEI